MRISKRQWEAYRREMIAHAGTTVFIFGNKLQGDSVVAANGVRREFEIAKESKLLLIPVGATGYMAKEIWQEIMNNFESYYPNHTELRPLFAALGDESDDERLTGTVIEIINKAKGR